MLKHIGVPEERNCGLPELHTRRSRFIFRKKLAGLPVTVMMAPTPDRKYGPNNWWTMEDRVVGCQNEYLKLLYYHLKY